MANLMQIVELPRLVHTTTLSLTSRVHARQSYWISSPNLSQGGHRRRSLSAISSTHAASSPLTVRSTIQASKHLPFGSSSTTPLHTGRSRGLAASTLVRHNGVCDTVFKPAQRAFHATTVRRRVHHFDTLKLVQRLKGEGFSEEQAVALMGVLNDVVEESIQNLTRT